MQAEVGYNARGFMTATSIAGITSDRRARWVCERDGRVLFKGLDLDIRPGERDRTHRSERLAARPRCCVASPGSPAISTVKSVMAGRFSYVGHRGGLNLQLTPLQNLRWYWRRSKGRMHRTNQLSSLLDGVGLAGYELTPCQQLSAGQQRRAALARLSFGNAALWLLDEPLTALDDAGCALVRELLARHRATGGAALLRHAPVTGSRSDAAACTRTCRVTAATVARAPSLGRAFTAQVQRDLTIAFRSRSELVNPLMFYVMGISMFPLGVGPGAERLAEIAPGACCGCWHCCRRCCRSTRCSAAISTTARWNKLVLNVDPLFVGVLAKVFAHWLVIGLRSRCCRRSRA
jgi:heme exporter protein A